MLKPDLYTPTLSADFWNSPSNETLQASSSKISHQCNDFSDFEKICELFTNFGPILAWILLGFFKDFVSEDKISVCKSGLNQQNLRAQEKDSL